MNHRRNMQCRCCKDIFTPDYRNTKTQLYCSKPVCRTASKVASQKRWSANNPNYFKGSIHVDRVREWRLANPGHRHRKRSCTMLQDDCDHIADTDQQFTQHLLPELQVAIPETQATAFVLQDYCLLQHPVFVGLIAHFTGCVLQDDIAMVTRRLEQLGHDVISSTAGGRYDPQVPNLSRSNPNYSRAVQLGGSPSGP